MSEPPADSLLYLAYITAVMAGHGPMAGHGEGGRGGRGGEGGRGGGRSEERGHDGTTAKW
jgi:hypothetical protein